MLGWALALTPAYLIAEVIGGFWFNSLAPRSDAAQMMTDVAALVIALMAIRLGQRATDDKLPVIKHSFGDARSRDAFMQWVIREDRAIGASSWETGPPRRPRCACERLDRIALELGFPREPKEH